MTSAALLSALASAPANALAAALDVALRGTPLLLGAWALAHVLRARSAQLRHAVWAASFLGLLALPLLSRLVPAWDLTVPRMLEVAAFRSPLAPQSGPGGAAAAGAPFAPLTVAWGIGAAAIALRAGLGLWIVGRRRREARPVRGARWRARVADAARAIGVDVPVRLYAHERVATPMTWGCLRPSILLPADHERWSEGRCESVLLHELAHVRRRDWWMQLAVLAVQSALWFHPLVWLAGRRLLVERELACDEEVVRAGARRSDYAGHLLALARCGGPGAAVTVGMARAHVLEDRLRRILSNEGASPRSGRPLAALCLLGLAPFASVHLVDPRVPAAPGPARGLFRFESDVDVRHRAGGAGESVWRGRVGDRVEEFEVHTGPDGTTRRWWRVNGEERPLGPRELARLESLLERERAGAQR